MSPVQNPKHIIIVGAGYAGLKAATRLARKTRHDDSVHITLVNGSDHFVERIRLHQMAADQPLKHIPIRDLLRGTNIQFVQGWVTKLEPDQKAIVVQKADGISRLPYDKLVYAAGSFIDTSVVPGGSEYAFSLNTEATTKALQERLPAIAERHGRLLIIGGGLTGIEAATELSETYPGLKVTLVTRGTFGADLSRKGANHIRKVFERKGVELIENTAITKISEKTADYEGGSLPFNLCLWAGAFAVPKLARESGLQVNTQGQVIVDKYLRSLSHPDMVAVGDAAGLEQALDIPIRMACATGIYMGTYAGDHVAAWANNQSPKPYQFGYVARCISLGRNDGLIQRVKPDDTPTEQIITGRAAANIKEIICRQTLWQIQMERWLPSGAKQGETSENSAEPVEARA